LARSRDSTEAGSDGHWLYEALVALRDGHKRLDLYHSALEVGVLHGTFVVEVTPSPIAS
jgi:hypothetical protein